MSSNLIMYIKGSTRGNPGYAGVGIIVCDHWGRILKKISEYIGILTTMQAEFRALLRGIEEARAMSAYRVKIFSDYEPMIKHMTGIIRLKGNDLAVMQEQIKGLSKGIQMEFSHIGRQKNMEAEKLSLEAIEGKLSDLKTQPEEHEFMKKDIDVRAVKAAVQRALLLDEFMKERPPEAFTAEELLSPDEKVDVPDSGREIRQPSPIAVEETRDTHDEDAELEEKEERQISAGGIVYKREGQKFKVCLISKKGGKVWALPKGRLIPGENLEETARREIAEETGVLTEVKEKIDEINYYFYWKDANVLYHKTVYFYLMPVIQENFCPRDSEADRVIWLTLGEAFKRLTYINEKEILKKAHKILKAK